jgi:hypothetical protein
MEYPSSTTEDFAFGICIKLFFAETDRRALLWSRGLIGRDLERTILHLHSYLFMPDRDRPIIHDGTGTRYIVHCTLYISTYLVQAYIHIHTMEQVSMSIKNWVLSYPHNNMYLSAFLLFVCYKLTITINNQQPNPSPLQTLICSTYSKVYLMSED